MGTPIVFGCDKHPDCLLCECGVDYQGALQGRTAQQKDIRCTNTECKNFGKIFFPTPWRSSGAQS